MLKSSPGGFRFDRFHLDPAGRQLRRDGARVELNARYLDALALLVREHGRLVTKDRFHQEVWNGVPVTDEALTQCVRTLRRQLGDDAGAPRFIQTVPKHGYRFIAAVEPDAEHVPTDSAQAGVGSGPGAAGWRWARILQTSGAGALGGALAGVLVGVLYGFAAASQPSLQPGSGAVSVLLVLVSLSIGLGAIAGAGIAFGIAAAGARFGRGTPWTIAGGAAAGLVVGALGKLLGLDAFILLFGRSPGDITGPLEGLTLGAALGLGAWVGARRGDGLAAPRSAVAAALAAGAVGVLLPLLGGRLLGGSLHLLASAFPESRIRLDAAGALFGEAGFGPASQAVSGALEAMLFGACVVGALAWAGRSSPG